MNLSLTLTEESRLRVFENRMFRKILGPRRDDVRGEENKLYKWKINDPYSSPQYFSGDQIEKN